MDLISSGKVTGNTRDVLALIQKVPTKPTAHIFVYGSKADSYTGDKLPLCLVGTETPTVNQVRVVSSFESNQSQVTNPHEVWARQVQTLLEKTTPVVLTIEHDDPLVLKSAAYHLADYLWGTNQEAKFMAHHVELRLKEFNYVPPFDPFEL